MKALASASCAAVLCGLTACGGTAARAPALTLRASVDGGAPVSVTAPFALNLPNIGDSGVVTADEGSGQVSFSLVPNADCANVVTISPGTQAMQQTVTAIKNGGQCTATAIAGNSTAVLTIFALPPP